MKWKQEVVKIAQLCAELWVYSDYQVVIKNPFKDTEYEEHFDNLFDAWAEYEKDCLRTEMEEADDLRFVNI